MINFSEKMKEYQQRARRIFLERQKKQKQEEIKRRHDLIRKREKMKKYLEMTPSVSKKSRSLRIKKRPRWGVDSELILKNTLKSKYLQRIIWNNRKEESVLKEAIEFPLKLTDKISSHILLILLRTNETKISI